MIGNDEKIEKFISGHRTAVLSMCLNTDSVYLWNNYAKENGYNIIFDKNIFVDSLSFFTARGEKKDKSYISHAKIVYNTNKQIEIIKEEINELVAEKEAGFDEIIVINTAVPQGNYTEIEKMIPVYYYNDINKKHYNILKFDRRAIKTIVCNSRKAKENVEDIISDIPIVLR